MAITSDNFSGHPDKKKYFKRQLGERLSVKKREKEAAVFGEEGEEVE